MFPRLTLSLLVGLLAIGPAFADDSNSCSSCKGPKPLNIYQGCRTGYRPPSVHPDTPFGFYPTCWREWPGGATCPRGGCGTSAIPPTAVPAPPTTIPDVEPLPPPRPAERTLKRTEPGEPQINPAAYRK